MNLSLVLSIGLSSDVLAEDKTDLITAIEKVAETVGAAVVSIKTERTEHYRASPSFYGDPFSDELFKGFFEDFFGSPPEYEYKSSGLGSGVIVDTNGYILTNEHVVRGADKLTVILPDGRSFSGQLKGTDTQSDLAVVKIDAPNLPAAKLGNSDQLKIGRWVVAIGNPFGHILADSQPTVTSGVISALHRALPQTARRDSDYSDLIQTDAAINPGNSGGPLVNLAGEVIGINVAIFSTSGGSQGIGFAIPVNYAKSIVDHLIHGKPIEHGWIGVSIQDLDYRLSQYFHLSNQEGVLIVKVLEGAPAKKAGLQEGDIILSINGDKIHNSAHLIKYLRGLPIGQKVSVEILRDKKRTTIAVVIGKRPGLEVGYAESQPQKPLVIKREEKWRGINVGSITDEMVARLRITNKEGVIITNIEKNSPAYDAGLVKGDIITSINNKTINNLEDFYQIIQTAKGECLIITPRGYFIIAE